jgi:hypothetical protein
MVAARNEIYRNPGCASQKSPRHMRQPRRALMSTTVWPARNLFGEWTAIAAVDVKDGESSITKVALRVSRLLAGAANMNYLFGQL